MIQCSANVRPHISHPGEGVVAPREGGALDKHLDLLEHDLKCEGDLVFGDPNLKRSGVVGFMLVVRCSTERALLARVRL